MIFSVVLIRYYSSMAGLSPARGLVWPGGRDIADNWQLLDKVKRAENDGEYIPLVFRR